MKKTRLVHLDGMTFEITEDTGETQEGLAIKIAESLALQEYYEKQAESFREQSQSERKKAKDRATLLFNLREYNRQKRRDEATGTVKKVSRMEPMEFYDEKLITEERKLLIDRANDFHKVADNFLLLARDEEQKVLVYKQEILALRSQSQS